LKAIVPEVIQEHTLDMLNRLREIAETTEDEKLQVAISQDWLDRAGYAPQRKVERQPQILLSEGAVVEIFRRLGESRGSVVVGEAPLALDPSRKIKEASISVGVLIE